MDQYVSDQMEGGGDEVGESDGDGGSGTGSVVEEGRSESEGSVMGVGGSVSAGPSQAKKKTLTGIHLPFTCETSSQKCQKILQGVISVPLIHVSSI